MRVALTHSVNTVAIKLADQLGIDEVKAFAHAAGIESELPDDLSLALGTGESLPAAEGGRRSVHRSRRWRRMSRSCSRA
jgi:membrane peptidoglycan carboxypeptidase